MNNALNNNWRSLKYVMISRWYWAGLVLLGVFMEAVALYYQYVVGDEPCQLCIHTRVWVAAFTLLAAIMCFLPQRGWLNLGGHGLATICMAGLWERCKLLWDIENHRGNSSCEFQLGFPDWFALDAWFPALFEVRNLCGYTPMMPLGITMAEMLITVSTLLLSLSVLALVVNLANK